MTLLSGLILAAIGLGTVGACAFVALYVARRATFDGMSELRDDFEANRLKTSNLRSEVVEYFERAAAAQNRARSSLQAAEKVKARETPDVPDMDEATYKAYLERGGSVNPAIEAKLGLH